MPKTKSQVYHIVNLITNNIVFDLKFNKRFLFRYLKNEPKDLNHLLKQPQDLAIELKSISEIWLTPREI